MPIIKSGGRRGGEGRGFLNPDEIFDWLFLEKEECGARAFILLDALRHTGPRSAPYLSGVRKQPEMGGMNILFVTGFINLSPSRDQLHIVDKCAFFCCPRNII